jgi:hypothetical protein
LTGSTAEYCENESFAPSCSPGETIVIGRAEFGHMAIGKCIEVNLGVFGCKVDVADILREECAGKQSCTISTDDPRLSNTRPCQKGILVYLKATYFCVKGKQVKALKTNCKNVIFFQQLLQSGCATASEQTVIRSSCRVLSPQLPSVPHPLDFLIKSL